MTNRLTPEQVAQLSDADMSERVAQVVFGATRISDTKHILSPGEYRRKPWGVMLSRPKGGIGLEPDYAASVLLVMEHMRQRWAAHKEATGVFWCWSFEDVGRYGWQVYAYRHDDRPDTPFYVRAKRLSFGRALFEVATLAAQEMTDAEGT